MRDATNGHLFGPTCTSTAANKGAVGGDCAAAGYMQGPTGVSRLVTCWCCSPQNLSSSAWLIFAKESHW